MDENLLVKEHERVDDLQRNGYVVIQDPKKFCFGVDAVFLTDFAQVREGETVVDLCSGSGVIPILLSAKTKGKYFIGLEIQEESVDMARRSVLLNKLSDKIEIQKGDIKDMQILYKPSIFDVVTCNPPYMDKGGGLLNPYSPKAIARHEILCSLEDVISGAVRVLKPQGRFYMVHRPHRLADIVQLMRQYKLEPKTLQFVHPYCDAEPSLILIEGIRGGNKFLKVRPPLILQDKRDNL